MPEPKKTFEPILGPILQKLAPKIGAKVVIEPKWKIVGQIIFKNGKKRYFRYSSLDLNSLGASDIAQDKDYANFFMKRLGYPTVRGEAFFSNEWAKTIGSARTIDKAYAYAKKLGLPASTRQAGFPIIVKPNSGSQGQGVTLVYSKPEFYRALRAIFKQDRVALVQKKVSGRDYRIVVLDNKVISAYERIPLNVTGDGRSNILSLLRKKQRSFEASSRDTRIKTDDLRIALKLRHQGLTMRSVPERGMNIFLLDNANLSTGGDSVEVYPNSYRAAGRGRVTLMHPEFEKLAVKLTKDMGLRLCGVDLMVDGLISEKPKKFWVLEINAAPGLDHYARTGKTQEKVVEDMYLEVLKSMEK